ncbi:MAG TPA: glycosyltransferase family 4 protein [Atribacterota bacterium]|nr:glycosyltransferase family 4 protein [Atribacterota bacterium]
MKNKAKLIIFNNIISPYRLPIFEELSKKYDLDVYFCKTKTKDRLWSTSLENYTFKYKILPSLNIGPLVFNFSLLKELFKNKSDCFIIAENPENAISILVVFVVAKINKSKIILWSERIGDEAYTLIQLKTSGNFLKNKLYNLIKVGYKIYRKYLYFKSDLLVPFSSAAENYLRKEGVLKEKIKRSLQIMPESILVKPTTISKLPEFKNKKIILSLGYLIKGKGVDNLIKAFNQLNSSDTVLLIAGAGDQEENLKELAKKNVDIKFIGYVEGKEKAYYFSMADFFVFPTHNDAWGFVINEALYYGLPVISTDQAGAIELIENGKNGLIIPDNDHDALVKSMKKLLDDPKLLAIMKENVIRTPKSRIVDVNTVIRTFDEAINMILNHQELNINKKNSPN